MRRQFWLTLVSGLVIAGLLVGCGGGNTPTTGGDVTAPAATATPAQRSAQVAEIDGGVDRRTVETADWQMAAVGDPLAVGGGVRTGETGQAKLTVSDGTIVRLARSTIFSLTELDPAPADGATRFKLEAGKVFVAVTKALGLGSFEIDTPNGVAAVRGSLMSAEFFPVDGRMIVTCLEGACRIQAPSGKFVDLQAGQQSGIPAYGKDPGGIITINTVQLQSWADLFPEAESLVRTITPGPPPTETPSGPGGAGGFGQTACDHPYFPLRAGATWTYDTDSGPQTWTVNSVTGDLNGATANMTLVSPAGTFDMSWDCLPGGMTSYQFGLFSFTQMGETASIDVSNQSGSWLPPLEMLTPGYSWPNGYDMRMQITIPGESTTLTLVGVVNETSTLVSNDPVTVGEQTFDGLQISSSTVTSMHFEGGGMPENVTTVDSTTTMVLARGVGIVSITTTAGDTSSFTSLTSYNVP